jgi:hypothetical protein
VALLKRKKANLEFIDFDLDRVMGGRVNGVKLGVWLSKP